MIEMDKYVATQNNMLQIIYLRSRRNLFLNSLNLLMRKQSQRDVMTFSKKPK